MKRRKSYEGLIDKNLERSYIHIKVKVNQSHYRPEVPRGFQ